MGFYTPWIFFLWIMAIGPIGALAEDLTTTRPHRFWVTNRDANGDGSVRDWIEAEDLRIGDRFLLADGTEAVLNAIESIHRDVESDALHPNLQPSTFNFQPRAFNLQPITTFNFEVANTHTYFVGSTGVWVHNHCPPDVVVFVKKFIDEEMSDWLHGTEIEKSDIFNLVINRYDPAFYEAPSIPGKWLCLRRDTIRAFLELAEKKGLSLHTKNSELSMSVFGSSGALPATNRAWRPWFRFLEYEYGGQQIIEQFGGTKGTYREFINTYLRRPEARIFSTDKAAQIFVELRKLAYKRGKRIRKWEADNPIDIEKYEAYWIPVPKTLEQLRRQRDVWVIHGHKGGDPRRRGPKKRH